VKARREEVLYYRAGGLQRHILALGYSIVAARKFPRVQALRRAEGISEDNLYGRWAETGAGDESQKLQ